ncbi:hypothetical protein, partial [uncultured Oscillibacter sp.]
TASSRSDWNSPFADATQITINGWNARAYNNSYSQTPAPNDIKDGVLYTYDADTLNSTGNTVNASLKAQAPSLAEIADLTDNGVTVEVYVCPVDADFITNVVVTRTQLMKVKTVASDYVRLEDIEPDSRDHYGKDNGPDSGLGRITGYNAFAIDGTEWSKKAMADVKDDNYDAYNVLKDMKAGDYVAVVPYTSDDGKTWEVGEAYAPETVSGRLTRVDIYNSEKRREGNAVAITVGGTSYPINEWNLDMLDITDNDIKATRKDVTVYLAKDGTALWTTEVGNTGDWIVVGDYYQGTNDSGKIVWYVHGWTLGGDEIDLDLGTIRGAAEKYAPGELVRYQINTTAGGGEYYLEKPNKNGSSVKKSGMYVSSPAEADYPVYPNNTPIDFDHQIEERAMATTGDPAKQWEGVYRVSLAYGDTPTMYNIKKNLDYIVLDHYGEETRTPSVPDTNDVTKDYVWDNVAVYYNTNPTFVYVSFDKTGEVETIYFAKGRQDVLNTDLRDYNTAWRNVGTNNDDFVASTAEAYVNDKGRVDAVVIKTDSADADLSGIRIITKNTGSNNYDKPNGAEEAAALTGKWNEREYVQGPDFNEAKTGTFDKGYKVGSVLVGNEKDGIFYAKEFHGDEYRGNSLDGFYVKGIRQVQNIHGNDLEDCFKVANDTSTFKTLGEQSLNNASRTELNKLLAKDDETETADKLNPNKEPGLIRCVNAKIVDVRVGHEGEITKLKDLLNDFDLDTVELKVLLNGKFGDANFRNAYVIVILNAQEKKNNAEAPTAALSVQTVAAPIVPVPFKGNGTESDPYVILAEPSTWVQLTATPSVKEGSLQTATAKWTVVNNASLNRAGNVIQAQAPAKAYDETDKTTVTKLVYSIDNYNPTVDGKKTVTGKVYVEIRATGESTAPGTLGSIKDYTAGGWDNSKFGLTVNTAKSGTVNASHQYTVFFDIDRTKAVKDGKVIPTATAVPTKVTYDVYLGDTKVTTVADAGIAALGNLAAGTQQIGNALLDPSAQLTVKVTSVEWSEVKVYYEYTGKYAEQAKAAGLKDGYTASVKAGVYKTTPATGELAIASNKITFVLNVDPTTTVQGAVNGGTYGTTTTGFGTTTEAANITANGTAPAAIATANNTVIAGTDPVVVTINTGSLTVYDQTFTVAGMAETDLNDDFDTLEDGIYNVTVNPTTQTVGKTSGKADVTVSWDAIAFAKKAYEITLVVVDDAGNEVSAVSAPIALLNDTTAGVKNVQLTGITANGTVTVKSVTELAGPEVTGVAGVPVGANWAAGDKIVLRFAGALDTATAGTKTIYAGDGTILETTAVTAATVNGSEVELTLAAPKSANGVGGTITIAAGAIASANGVRNGAAITITFAATSVSI